MNVFEEAIREKVQPDARTYTILLRGCIAAGLSNDAAGLIRAAFGLRGAHPRIAGPDARVALLRGGLSSELISEVLEGISFRCGSELLAVQLFRDLQSLPSTHLDPKLPFRLAAKATEARRGA